MRHAHEKHAVVTRGSVRCPQPSWPRAAAELHRKDTTILLIRPPLVTARRCRLQ
jgi:hypothetical protein